MAMQKQCDHLHASSVTRPIISAGRGPKSASSCFQNLFTTAKPSEMTFAGQGATFASGSRDCDVFSEGEQAMVVVSVPQRTAGLCLVQPGPSRGWQGDDIGERRSATTVEPSSRNAAELGPSQQMPVGPRWPYRSGRDATGRAADQRKLAPSRSGVRRPPAAARHHEPGTFKPPLNRVGGRASAHDAPPETPAATAARRRAPGCMVPARQAHHGHLVDASVPAKVAIIGERQMVFGC